MTTFLLVWYALGWVACGLGFLLLKPEFRCPEGLVIIFGPIVLIMTIGIWMIFRVETYKISKKSQYLWRKP